MVSSHLPRFRTLLLSGALCAYVALSAAPQAAAQDAAGTNIDVTRVTLATGGLAEVEGIMAEPGDTMRFAIERALVADVLRTLVITGEAPVRAIDLEAAEPVGERSITGRLLSGDLANPATILRALVGEEVEVRGGATQLTGRLLAFTPVILEAGGDTGARAALRIAVATEDGRVAYATFETESPLAIEGPAVRARMQDVVPALRQSVDDGRRELTVKLGAEAAAGFSFVVPTTVWRPSYRAILGSGGAVDLQGWATLENTTGLDWNGIDLRLAVGTPVAYRQDVYAPLRTNRPLAPFAVGRTAVGPALSAEEEEQLRRSLTRYAQPSMAQLNAMRARDTEAAPAPSSPAAQLETGGPALVGSASTLFPVAGAIDLAAGRTLTVPFLDGSQDAERIAYLELDANPAAMDALDIAFDPDATVPGGLIAVYDEAGFVGDARFAGADGGERSILPFARSTDVNIKVTRQTRQLLSRASIVDGMLRVRREARRQMVLAVEAAEPITLVVDVPRIGNEALSADTPLPHELTDHTQVTSRLRIDVPAGPTRIDLTGSRPLTEQYTVSNIPTAVIDEVLAIGGAVDEDTAARLRRVAEAAQTIAAIDRQIMRLETDVSDLREAVSADRETLEAIDVSTPEGARMRDRIVARSDEIDGLLTTLRTLRGERLEAEQAMRNP
ncbi:MAG: DUF4139 domain-containing protein [Pseudomonadota bacterium]